MARRLQAPTCNDPTGIAVDSSGNLYIADSQNNVVRKVTSSGTISTFAGSNTLGAGLSGDGGVGDQRAAEPPTRRGGGCSGKCLHRRHQQQPDPEGHHRWKDQHGDLGTGRATLGGRGFAFPIVHRGDARQPGLEDRCEGTIFHDRGNRRCGLFGRRRHGGKCDCCGSPTEWRSTPRARSTSPTTATAVSGRSG